MINVPTEALAKKLVACGNTSGESVDKFKKFHLAPMAGTVVKALLIAECCANLECKVVDRKLVAKYNFFILEVVKAWINPRAQRPRTIHHQGEGVFGFGKDDRVAFPKNFAAYNTMPLQFKIVGDKFAAIKNRSRS